MGHTEWGTLACRGTSTDMNCSVGMGLPGFIPPNFLLLLVPAEVTEFSFLLTCPEPWLSC